MNKIDLFKKISNCNSSGISDLVDTSILDGSLRFGNGGGWCRFDGKFGKKYKILTIKNNGLIRFSWDISEKEKSYYDSKYDFKNQGNFIRYIKMCGIQNENHSRPIGTKIRNFFKNKPCVSCGSNSFTEIDHKNGLYNDPEVLKIETQQTHHFQILCKHCNDQKRQTIKQMKKTNERYPATDIPMLKTFGVRFTNGCERFNPGDPNWGVGTYWHDPIKFMETIRSFHM